MFFLQQIYNRVASIYANSFNHFALIKLIFYSLDKTIFYFLVFMFVRIIWLIVVKKRRTVLSEAGLWVFVLYLILLLMLTTFRTTYFPWQIQFNWHRSLDNVNVIFLKQTFKLLRGASLLDFFYNSFGNILWFMPFGLLFPNVIRKKRAFIPTTICGMLLSLFIEVMQFGLATGISDIDDIFFNTCGVLLGYGLYLVLFIKNK